ncbi:MAG: sulfatase-like hydrolase/transferase [Puniceicoccaceae bacterium]
MAAERPNIVLLIADDVSPDFSCYDFPVQPLNIDRLAAGVVRFNNAYVAASSSSPSRCSIIIGRYAHNIGALDLQMALPKGQFLFPKALKDSGYYCAKFGKFHMGDYSKEGFDVVQENPTYAPRACQLTPGFLRMNAMYRPRGDAFLP